MKTLIIISFILLFSSTAYAQERGQGDDTPRMCVYAGQNYSQGSSRNGQKCDRGEWSDRRPTITPNATLSRAGMAKLAKLCLECNCCVVE